MKRVAIALLIAVGAASQANAFEFRCRFVERVGNVDVPLPGNYIEAFDGTPRNIRLQFGVFDDADGPAPAGGFVGWNAGMLCVQGCMGEPTPPDDNSDERTNPGRLSPFNFAPGGTPPGPFECLTDIDATLGTQSPFWGCGPDGSPLPQPDATVRGINSYVSVFAFSIDPAAGGVPYEVLATGNLIAAFEWRAVGTPIPPDCTDPANPIPGSVTYAPFPTAPEAFECTLFVNCIPAPGATTLALLAGALAARRRRPTDEPAA